MDISIRGLRKTFGNSPAIHGVDLEIRSGELLGLLGPSGSGKTTLLRMIAGLEIPSAGSIFFGDEDASYKSVQERRVGFVFQTYALFRHMNVTDNIAYGLRVRPKHERPASADIRKRVADLLDMMQLGGFGDRFPAQLSGGQRQRVALARALAVEPRVLLLDEPFGALDAQVRKDLRRWLRDIHDRTGHTTVFVTHDQDEALELSDRVAVLARGRLEQLGPPDEIYGSPATPFVHGFIGEASRLYVEIKGGLVRLGGADLGLPSQSASDGAAQLFFRPQQAVIENHDGAHLRGVVKAVRNIGGVRRVEIQLHDGGPLVETECPLDRTVAAGERVGVRLKDYRIFSAAA